VGLSFAQSAADVRMLHAKLVALGAPQVGVVLKIETQRGFEHLPEMLLAAMASPATGVMIARGDLAVECGFERLAEVQEEILWACEAAHLPVVWATQVLEGLAKTGQPSRAEITDAAMAGRAECVMLNKGPYVVEAIRTLDDILRRMQAHQEKKRPLLRALKAWA
jgi:pyruvate kinase